MEELIQYIKASKNLYGLILKSKLVEIYNRQNEDKIGEKNIEDVFKSSKKEIHGIYPYDDYLVHETIMEFDEVDLYLKRKGNKPYYIPEKSEFLKYADNDYYEITPEFTALKDYAQEHFFNAEMAHDLCDDIMIVCSMIYEMQDVLTEFERRGVVFKDVEQANEVMKLVTNHINNIRMWENNGHTPKELHEIGNGPDLRNTMKYNFDGVKIKKEKIGRNDPCPCGSGKKYKKCCL
jgi:hypothetical protein